VFDGQEGRADVDLSRSNEAPRTSWIGSCIAPSTRPPKKGRCSQGLRTRTASAFATLQFAGRSKSSPRMKSVAFTWSIMRLGFSSETEAFGEATIRFSNILGVMQPPVSYGANVGLVANGFSNSGHGH
jgi:hypothetical protein